MWSVETINFLLDVLEKMIVRCSSEDAEEKCRLVKQAMACLAEEGRMLEEASDHCQTSFTEPLKRGGIRPAADRLTSSLERLRQAREQLYKPEEKPEYATNNKITSSPS